MFYLIILILVLAIAMSWIIAISKEGKTLLKVAGITVLMYISFSILFSFQEVQGWPSYQKIPERTVVWSVQIQEPRQRDNFDGAIYLWLVMENPTNKCPPGLICVKTAEPNMPRAYRLKYSKEMHEKMYQIMMRIQNGEIIVLENKGNSDSAEDLEAKDLSSVIERLRKD